MMMLRDVLLPFLLLPILLRPPVASLLVGVLPLPPIGCCGGCGGQCCMLDRWVTLKCLVIYFVFVFLRFVVFFLYVEIGSEDRESVLVLKEEYGAKKWRDMKYEKCIIY